MNPIRMLELCRRGQWDVDRDIDWSGTPRSMSPEDERAIVQYFVDMAGIERVAAALFEEQGRRVTDKTMQAIFATFVDDERRHAIVAERLAAYYDVRKLERYTTSPSLVTFSHHFVRALRYASPETANVYVTAGELLLDVALLRSIDDFVADPMSHRAMELVNRDESRHIAVDYYMTELYASADYQAWLAAQPAPSLAQRVRGAWAFANLLYAVGPFAADVFVRPMRLVDPSGRRIHEALKRFQMLGEKPDVAARPFMRFANGFRATASHPVVGPVFVAAMSSFSGTSLVGLLGEHLSEDERREARRMTIDELAEDALRAKALA